MDSKFSAEEKIIRDYKFLITQMLELFPFTDGKCTETDSIKLLWRQKFIKHCMDRGDYGRNRNIYLAKFIECLKNDKLYGPFLAIPPLAELPPWPIVKKVLPNKKQVKVTDAIFAGKETKIDTNGTPFKYHFARKSLDYGRGICVCFALTFYPSQDVEGDDYNPEAEPWDQVGQLNEPHPIQKE